MESKIKCVQAIRYDGTIQSYNELVKNYKAEKLSTAWSVCQPDDIRKSKIRGVSFCDDKGSMCAKFTGNLIIFDIGGHGIHLKAGDYYEFDIEDEDLK